MHGLLREGFLGTAAPLYADLILFLEMVMGLALIVGAVLARQKRFLLHAWCQSTVLLLNAAIIAFLMLPSFVLHVRPRIPAKLAKPYYALATTHAALGTVAEVGGLYILLAAGTTILPQRFRLSRYRLWMRVELVLWWLVLLLGMITYARWYVPHGR
jgi:uncharacterized membrane protein YozB (DUF420 family)